MRLQSFLSKAGVTSRRKVVQELEEGKVKVNGEVVRIPSFPVSPEKDEITYLGKPVHFVNHKYFIFYKPKGVISTVEDTHGRKTVMDFFRHVKERIYPVGRLDQDTTGLLLLTNDGDFANHLTHPRYGIKKVYDVVLSRPVREDDLRELEHGVEIEGETTAPCKIKLLSRDVCPVVEVTLHEGRKRQVRLMFQAIGNHVIDLHRKFYGPLDLTGLQPGQSRELTPSELALLQKDSERGLERPSFKSKRHSRPFLKGRKQFRRS